ncbi:MAG: DNA alkylation response protein [Actinomycetia bacterium]|nr:DNA alkylation response protein [Actinomycetes bacterium]
MPNPSPANQPPPLVPYNLFITDPVLGEAVEREGGGASLDGLVAFGERVGSAEVFEWGELANRFEPELVTHDRFGERADEVRYHPAYHSLMEMSVSEGLHCRHYESTPGEGGYVARNAAMFMMAQAEVGHGCPISMTGAVLYALEHQPDLAGVWGPMVGSRTYDPVLRAPQDKAGVLLGMAMTERQGGSDVRANTSAAVPVNGGGPGGEYRLTGSKWFVSAPMCDAFLALAYTPGGLSCFLVPRVRPDGSRNQLHLMRLKDKLGNRSNASSEVELVDAAAWMVGEEGRGVRTIIDMVSGTRLDCTNWAAALMRQAVAQAGWHVANRSAFGATLIDKPLMQNVLADLEIETEAATLLVVRLSGAFERAAVDPGEAALARIGAAVAKYWLTKRSTPVVREALECVGGNGYVEESILPRLYREAPLNSIWEGSGNVIALDVLRALARTPEAAGVFVAELERGAGRDPRVDEAIAQSRAALLDAIGDEVGARRIVEQLAITWTASLLVQHGHTDVADTYLRSRLEGDWGAELGTLPTDAPLQPIASRAIPAR